MAGSHLAKKRAAEAVLSKTQVRIAELMAEGVPTATIARKLGKGDPKRSKLWRRRITYWCKDPHFQKAVFDLYRGEVVAGLGPAIAGMNARAARGRIDAVKLAFATSGFHNDKVDHKHSGEIQINVSIPRPTKTVDELGPGKESESYVDADVVED